MDTYTSIPQPETVGQIAANDLRKVDVFKKFGIEFCCGGKKTLQKACEDAGVDLKTVQTALDNVQDKQSANHRFDQWDLDFLADYIINEHHNYYYKEAPAIEELLNKVAYRHGAAHPELLSLQQIFHSLNSELKDHFAKEENILFPFIKQIAKAHREPHPVINAPFSIENPIRVMEEEHEEAGLLLNKIQQLTHQYNAPEGACNSFKFLYHKLNALDEDLRIHMHLENNLLFPKALALV